MSVYGFNDRSVAEVLKAVASQHQQGASPWSAAPGGIIYQTPSGGIPARSGTTLGKADCTPYWLSVDATSGDCTIERMQSGGANVSDETIYNLSETAVGGSSYIIAFNTFNVLVAVWEDCA